MVLIYSGRSLAVFKYLTLTMSLNLLLYSEVFLTYSKRINGPRQANLVLIAYASSEGSGEPAHPRSLASTFAARSYKQ